MKNRPKLQDCVPMTWAEVEAYGNKHGFGFLDEHRGLDGWHKCRVAVTDLRNMHGDFGRVEDSFVQLRKGQLLSEQLLAMKDRVSDGNFPRAATIRSQWPNKPMIVAQKTKSSGQLYVVDGVTRTFHACYHGEQWLDALVITLDQEREVV